MEILTFRWAYFDFSWCRFLVKLPCISHCCPVRKCSFHDFLNPGSCWFLFHWTPVYWRKPSLIPPDSYRKDIQHWGTKMLRLSPTTWFSAFGFVNPSTPSFRKTFFFRLYTQTPCWLTMITQLHHLDVHLHTATQGLNITVVRHRPRK